jgi:hypothetical protein
VRERVLALRVGHLGEMVAVAVGQRGDRGPEGSVRQEVVGRVGHPASMAPAIREAIPHGAGEAGRRDRSPYSYKVRAARIT